MHAGRVSRREAGWGQSREMGSGGMIPGPCPLCLPGPCSTTSIIPPTQQDSHCSGCEQRGSGHSSASGSARRCPLSSGEAARESSLQEELQLPLWGGGKEGGTRLCLPRLFPRPRPSSPDKQNYRRN